METDCLGTIPNFLEIPDNSTRTLLQVGGSNQKAAWCCSQSRLENHSGAGKGAGPLGNLHTGAQRPGCRGALRVCQELSALSLELESQNQEIRSQDRVKTPTAAAHLLLPSSLHLRSTQTTAK